MEQLDYRLADVLCCTKGFRLAVKSMTGGNKAAQSALLEFVKYIEENLASSKKTLNSSLYAPKKIEADQDELLKTIGELMDELETSSPEVYSQSEIVARANDTFKKFRS